MKKHTLQLRIAEFNLELTSTSKLELDEGYDLFIVENKPDIDIFIACFAGFPEDLSLINNELVFEAANDQQKFYSIYKQSDGLIFVIFNQKEINTIQQIGYLNASFSHWKIFSQENNGVLQPLAYPMGPILLHYMTLQSDAVMMHASCAFDGLKGRLFSGFSGAGKSTMSKIWSDAGNQIINDDRLIIRYQQGAYFVYNTPMYYTDKPKKASLNSIFLISHSPVNKIKHLKGAEAVTKVMAFSIQNNFDPYWVEKRLEFFSKLCSQISVYSLGFVPNENVVKFILENESK
jgi:hypothetical protein